MVGIEKGTSGWSGNSAFCRLCHRGRQGKEGVREVRERLEMGWRRLVERGPEGMGRLYKVLAIVPETGGKRPVGFGGGVG